MNINSRITFGATNLIVKGANGPEDTKETKITYADGQRVRVEPWNGPNPGTYRSDRIYVTPNCGLPEDTKSFRFNLNTVTGVKLENLEENTILQKLLRTKGLAFLEDGKVLKNLL